VNAVDDFPQWVRLFRIARSLIRQVNSDQMIVDNWALGGGTALMLRIAHRESYDIDIFISDAQLLQFFDPERRDFEFDIRPDGWRSDGARFIKLAFQGIGQIDFIVAGALTSSPSTEARVDDGIIQLETIDEIITKKIHFRAASLQPRDIFDIAAAAEQHKEALIKSLRMYPGDVAQALAALNKMSPEFISLAIGQLTIKDPYRALAKSAFQRSKDLLGAV
jgi:hypothetical protein